LHCKQSLGGGQETVIRCGKQHTEDAGRAKAVDSPGWVATDMGGTGAPWFGDRGRYRYRKGILPDEAPTGGFFRGRQAIAVVTFKSLAGVARNL